MFPILESLEGQISPLSPEQKTCLEHAHLLVSQGQFQPAARIFADLSLEMEKAGNLRHAATFHTQAAYAFADSQNESAALSHARSAIHLFLQCHAGKRAQDFYMNIVQVLANRDMAAAVQTLQHELGVRVGALEADVSGYLVQTHARLPACCPRCGAPINGADLHWTDSSTAECNYCGSPVRGED